jgi:tRNA G26 N,N-dimethylase Trm1
MNRRKVYVTVNAEHKPDGSCCPKTIRMADEAEYEIDKILQVCPAASAVGGRGVRYTVRIGQSKTHLFDEQNGRWFVEAKFG